MAKLTVKIIHTGEELEVKDIDLSQTTPRQLIDELIKFGYLAVCFHNADYSILNTYGSLVADLNLTFEQLGIADGDTIRIIMKGTGGGGSMADFDIEAEVDTSCDVTYESLPISVEKCKERIDHIKSLHQDYKSLCHSMNSDVNIYINSFISGMKRMDSIEKMRDLLEERLAQLQNLSSLFDMIYINDEFNMIEELLVLIKETRREQEEFLGHICERQAYIAVEQRHVNERGNYFMELCLSEYERELDKLLEKKRQIEKEIKTSREENNYDIVYSSVFAPSEVKRKSHMLVQIYLHLFEETEKVKSLAQESQKDAERRDYIPLLCKLKKGDRVDVLMNIYGDALLSSEKKTVLWQGFFTKCSFDYIVPQNIEVEELSCQTLLSVNNIPIGEMRFITKIVEKPTQLNTEIIAHKYRKVFISYSHQDETKVRFLHEGLELGGIPHFFDRQYLKAGDVFPQIIQDYINSADLFVLCWSENAANSEYVKKERLQALALAYPQVKPQQAAKLSIYPMSIEPRAELPVDMKENYHFGEI